MKVRIALVLAFAGLTLSSARLHASTELTVHLRSYGGYYLVADSGGYVKADRTSAQSWETFTLVDLNGGDLEHLDYVALRAYNGYYIWANGWDLAAWWYPYYSDIYDWTTFQIINADDFESTITNGTNIALYSEWVGYLVCAENGGNAAEFPYVSVNRNVIGGWETFNLEIE